MSKKTSELGKRGEAFAEEHLSRNGFRVIASNCTTKYGEIDIVAMEDDVICFIEVKTRTSDAAGRPEEAVTLSKKCKIARTARKFLLEKRCYGRPCRFDVVAIIMPYDGEPSVEVFKNAFTLDEIGMRWV